jgi:thiamine transport system substrate-binding protein
MRAVRFSASAAFVALCTPLLLSACGDSGTSDAPVSLTLVVYDSFPLKDTSVNAALTTFSADTGIQVRLVDAGDAGTMASKATLTAGNPEGDVMWGIDNTLLSRVIDGDVFQPYTSTQIGAIDPALRELVPDDEMTPVDFGDVCINYDIAWFDDHDIAPPTALMDLTKDQYRDLLVVENPASSSPGLAFLLATVATFGPDGWQAYWASLRDNGMQVVDSWTSAYYEQFSGSSGKGPRPLVVSYASSPPAEVIFADPPRTDAPTAVMTSSCFRQVEFAGVLRGTEHADEAGELVDFLAGAVFQSEVALNLFVWPARTDVAPPAEFTKYSVVVDDPLTVSPADIAADREQWVDQWTEIVLR